MSIFVLLAEQRNYFSLFMAYFRLDYGTTQWHIQDDSLLLYLYCITGSLTQDKSVLHSLCENKYLIKMYGTLEYFFIMISDSSLRD